MNNLLPVIVYISTGGAVAAFCYGIIKVFFLTNYADYQERMIRSFDERGGNLSLVINPQKLTHLTLLLCSGLFILGILVSGHDLFTGMFLGCILMTPGLLMPRIVLNIILARRLARISEQLPAGLELLANSMRAGMTLSVALERNLARMPEDLKMELSVVMHEFKIGTSLSEAIQKWADRIQMPDVKLVAAASVLTLQRGGSLSEVFFVLSSLIRQRQDFNREVKAMTAEGRFQALLMTALPFVLIVIMTLVNHETMMIFLTHPIGKLLLGLMVAMQIGAYLWIRKIVTFNL